MTDQADEEEAMTETQYVNCLVTVAIIVFSLSLVLVR
jgi:hypothetical protein